MGNLSRRSTLAVAATGTVTLGASAAATGAANPVSQQRPRVDHYTTAPNAELIPTITRVMGPPYRFTTLYSLKLPGLRSGDVVQAHCQFEVTNDLGINVMIGHAMLAHRKETVINHGDPPEGQVIS